MSESCEVFELAGSMTVSVMILDNINANVRLEKAQKAQPFLSKQPSEGVVWSNCFAKSIL